MNVEDCMLKGLLKEGPPSLEKAERSAQMAETKLELARREKTARIFESAIIAAYSSMFHASRAILFRDGYREKSHFGVFVYIKEKYSDKLEPRFINELNNLRLERHNLLYGLEKSDIQETEAEDTIKIAQDFLAAVQKIIHNKRNIGLPSR